MELQKYFYIALGGSVGALARYWVGSVMAGKFGARFPYGTFLVNLSACILLGFSMEILDRHMELSSGWRYLVPIGFVGSYSTFSTFEWETFASLQVGAFLIASLYVVGSVLLGLAGLWCGGLLGRIAP